MHQDLSAQVTFKS